MQAEANNQNHQNDDETLPPPAPSDKTYLSFLAFLAVVNAGAFIFIANTGETIDKFEIIGFALLVGLSIIFGTLPAPIWTVFPPFDPTPPWYPNENDETEAVAANPSGTRNPTFVV